MPRRNQKTRLLLLACCPVLFTLHLFASQSAAENWPRFRGDNGVGVVSSGGKLPTEWSPGDFSWNIELPGLGHASPVIWGDKLFVTSAIDEGAVRYLFCLNAATGEQIWSRVIGLARSHKHNKNSWASSTPAVDGEHVYVAFADEETHTLTAYDFSGDIVWRRDIGTFESQHGQGVSPVVYNDLVILPNDQMGPSSVMAFDRQTGHTVWSTIRTHRRTSYATPLILRHEGRPDELICLSGAMGISSLNPNTGHLNWLTGELPARTVASPIVADGLIIASCGGGGIGKLLIAVEPGGSGDVSKTHIRYTRERILPYVPTPVAYEGHIYLWNDNGVISCVRAEDGKNVWTQRAGGNFSGSPIAVDGKLYCISEEGEVVVIAASPTYELLGRTNLGDPSHSTPAFANGRLYLRTFHRLACLEARK